MDGFGVSTAYRFCASPHSVRDARHAALAFAHQHEVPAEKLEAIALAVSEATTNVVLHAYRERDVPGAFTLELDIAAGSLLIDVRDDGVGMGPRDDSPGMGFGLPLIARVADAHGFLPTEGGGTWLAMRFDLT
jgi:serine/threonine-protein kinase RsbW